jgi:release factor glutamine methyltransferase
MTAAPDPALVARLRAAGCVFAEDEARMLVETASSAVELERMVASRIGGEPLEAVLGWVAFDGLRLAVEPGVFVPRRRTELLVRCAADLGLAGSTVVDLCCGLGAVGAALLAREPRIDLYAADIDPAAVRNARRNLDPARVFEGDLYAPLPGRLRERVDVIVANAPYVPTDAIATMPREARLFEAFVALDGGSDGLDLHRRIAAAATEWLAPAGRLLIESSARQAPLTAALLERAGLAAHVVHDDELDGTVVIGTRSDATKAPANR